MELELTPGTGLQFQTSDVELESDRDLAPVTDTWQNYPLLTNLRLGEVVRTPLVRIAIS